MNVRLAYALVAGLVNGGTTFVTQGDLALSVSALVGTVAVTIAVTSWIDSRIDKKIKPLQDKMDKLYEHFVPAEPED